MKLIIEDSDAHTTLAPGTYDVSDLGAVLGVQVNSGYVEIDLRLSTSFRPEPGTTDEPHFKVGVSCKRDMMRKGYEIITFARPEPDVGQGFGFKDEISDHDLRQRSAIGVEPFIEQSIKKSVDAITAEICKILVRHAITDIMSLPSIKRKGKPAKKDDEAERLAKFFGAPVKSPACDECNGTGEYVSPVTGDSSPCSKGCPKP